MSYAGGGGSKHAPQIGNSPHAPSISLNLNVTA